MDLKSHRTRKLSKLAALFLIDGLFFSVTNPNRVYAAVIIIGFLLVVITTYVLIDFLLLMVDRIVPFSLRTKKRIALATTLVWSLLLAMQSIGQLTPKDVLAVIPLVLVLSFYFSYTMARKTG